MGEGLSLCAGGDCTFTMSDIKNLIREDAFLNSLFGSIPCGVLVVDSDRRVQAVNNVVERTFGISEAEVKDKRGGEALNCIHAHKDSEGCGYAEECQSCRVKQTALDALSGQRVFRNRALVELAHNDTVIERDLLVSAGPLEFRGSHYAVMMLEDITELSRLRRRLREEHSFRGIIGKDRKMQELFENIRELADVDVPVLIQGETGTGKELVASALHNEGSRSNGLFVPVNCGALPENLLESELFGHVKGAFTGAVRDKKGRFELAHRGTILLDEIGEISPAMQVKVLRVLEQGTFERVGGEKTIKADVRVLSATNKDLSREMNAGRFRKDLFYRLNVVPVTLPPLRERKGDIPLLAGNFIRQMSEEKNIDPPELSSQALDILMDYTWPGNIRELKNWMQFAVLKSKGGTIWPLHLPPVAESLLGDTSHRRRCKLDEESVRDMLEETEGNKAEAARRLNVARATLYRFLKEKGLS